MGGKPGIITEGADANSDGYRQVMFILKRWLAGMRLSGCAAEGRKPEAGNRSKSE
ncbi:hypothetical protein SAMN05720354_10561 [Nitrosospira sp. Nsp1]|nr:hypothetical protein SAMN05720354_10561 [Nitrosospira sp. Nsp1]